MSGCGKGYQVFRDLIGDGFNVDHVVIGPAGVFAVETRSRSRPVRGSLKINFDGERVLVVGHQPAVLSPEDIKPASCHLSRFVRSSEKRM